MDPKNLNIGRPSTYASFIEKIQQRSYVETKDIEGKKIQVNKYTAKKTDLKNIDLDTKEIVLGKEKKKLVPTALGISVTEFLEKNFKLLMDYQFTAKMETELDDIAEGTLNSVKVMKNFYDYVMKCLSDITPNPGILIANSAGGTNAIIVGKYGDDDIKLLNGPYGKYIQCGNAKINLKQLCLDLQVAESELESDKKLLTDSVIEKLESKANNPGKTWKIGKFTYTLKSGRYGLYIEESTAISKKPNNYSITYMLNFIANANSIDLAEENNIERVIELITEKNITDTVEYFKSTKSNKTSTNPNSDKKELEKEKVKVEKFIEEKPKKVNKSTKSKK
jgi:DNA topoisomerase-1